MPIKPHPEGISLSIRLTPGARQTACHGMTDTGGGKKALKISVQAPPEDGAANKALIDFLAKSLRITKSSLSIISGPASRLKVVLAKGNEPELRTAASKLIKP